MFFDAETPGMFKEKVAEYSDAKNFVPIYISARTEQYDRDMRKAIMSCMTGGARFVVTTRLDNDDALGIRFVETIKEIVSKKCELQTGGNKFYEGIYMEQAYF